MLGILRLKDLGHPGEYALCDVQYFGHESKGKDEIGFKGYFFQFYEFYSTHYIHKQDLKGKVTSFYPRIII